VVTAGSEILKKRTDLANALGGAVGAAVTLAGAVGAGMQGVADALTKFLGPPANWSWPQVLIVIGLVVLAATGAVRAIRTKPSYLLQPDKLWRDPSAPNQLIGREDDLRRLRVQLVNRLVYLVGESGCGKTALLRAGLSRDEETLRQYLPIFIDMSPHDWSDSLLAALRDEFIRSLPADDPGRDKLSADSEADEYAEIFGDYRVRTGRRVLLLLDQFDDFQAQPRHRHRFYPPDTGVVRTASEIKSENAFWRVLDTCLNQNALHVIVAARAEAAAHGLRSIELIAEPPPYPLLRLPADLALSVVSAMADREVDGKPIIAFPLRGWVMLRDRLARDLQARGDVLPQQLKVAMGGLRSLKRLTLGAYTRKGGLAAIEAAFVDHAVASAAATYRIDTRVVLDTLLALVDRDRTPPDKTPAKSVQDLWLEDAAADIATHALEVLAREDIVRRLGHGDKGRDLWQLDHAYLAQPILRLYRDRNKWTYALADRARAHTEAGVAGFWRTLLPLREQVLMAVARLRPSDPFRYRGHRGFAAISLLRASPAVVVLAASAIGVWAFQEWNRAATILAQLASSSVVVLPNGMLDSTVEGLLDLQSSGPFVRWRITDRIVTESYSGFLSRMAFPAVARALVGLDQRIRVQILRLHLSPAKLDYASDQPFNRASSLAYELLGSQLPGDLEDRLWNETIALLPTRSPMLTHAAAELLLRLAPYRPDSDAKVAALLAQLREEITKTPHIYELHSSSVQYVALAGLLKQSDLEAALVLVRLREAIQKATDPYQLAALSLTYANVLGRMRADDPEVEKVRGRLREIVEKTTDPGQFVELSYAYASVLGHVKGGDREVAALLAKLGKEIGRTADPRQLGAFFAAYIAVAGRLKAEDPDAVRELSRLGGMIETGTDPYQIALNTIGYMALSERLPAIDPEVRKISARLQEVIGITTDAYNFGVLCEAYATVLGRLKPDERELRRLLVRLREAMVETTDSHTLHVLSFAYASIAERTVPDMLAKSDIRILRDLLHRVRSAEQMQSMADAMLTVAIRAKPAMTWQQVGALATHLLHHPLSAGEPTKFILDTYEAYLKSLGPVAPRIEQQWNGDIWAFVAWATEDGRLPGFHPRRVTLSAMGLAD